MTNAFLKFTTNFQFYVSINSGGFEFVENLFGGDAYWFSSLGYWIMLKPSTAPRCTTKSYYRYSDRFTWSAARRSQYEITEKQMTREFQKPAFPGPKKCNLFKHDLYKGLTFSKLYTSVSVGTDTPCSGVPADYNSVIHISQCHRRSF